MKDYGHIMIWTLPFALFGLIETIRRIREPVFRIILIGWLATPIATAFVEVGISRTMSIVFTMAILTAIGFDKFIAWIENPINRLNYWIEDKSPSRLKIISSSVVLLSGVIVSILVSKTIDKVTIFFFAFILALQISGLLNPIAKRIKDFSFLKHWNVCQTQISWSVFIVLFSVNMFMFVDALRNGPTWYKTYGLGGMQYGAFQVFEPIQEYAMQHPETRVLFSPAWTNGTDVIVRFFLDDDSPILFHSILGYIDNKLQIDNNTLFIMTKEEYNIAIQSEKLTDFQIENTIPCPDGTTCFYFVRLRYSDIADELFAQEKALRQQLQESTIKINGEDVKIRHTYLEADDQNLSIQLIFDNDPYTFVKTYEANPFVIELTFPTPRIINGFSIIIGSVEVSITMTAYSAPGANPVSYQFEGQGYFESPELSFDFPEPIMVQMLHIEQLDIYAGEPNKNHIWEITFR
ncbi:MAG TPA: hypothetical protein DHW49_03800 [Anaerolineae bacterium]|nr:hypothetical protein [Anaerolineae bacterium]